MKLKTKILKWSAGVPVAMLNEKTATKIGVHANERILIVKDSKEFSTIVDTVGELIDEDEIAVSFELKNRLNLKHREFVDVSLGATPESMVFVTQKLNNKKLNQHQIYKIIQDIVNNSLSEAEIALFVSAMYENGMSMHETIFLIKSILKLGKRLNLNHKFVVDKHSIGGIPGNRTTPIIVSICAAAGLIFPKTSSRAITSPAGTADVIETIARVEFSSKELKSILKKTNACLVWGGALDLAPADDKIIHIEKLLKIDPEAQLLASIIAKKLAVGSNYILIDIPYGNGAKVSKEHALKLKKKFEYLGRYFKKKLICVLTDGSQPIGNGIGPALEIRDVLKILDPNQEGPRDLEDKSLFLSGKILEMTGKAEKGKGALKAMEILDSGEAFKKFKEIISAQSGNINKIPEARYKKDIFLKKSGKIIRIDNKLITALARICGCPADKSAGLYLYSHVGEELKKGDKLITIYTESKNRLNEAVSFFTNAKPIIIS